MSKPPPLPKLLCGLLLALAAISAVSALQADDISDAIAQKKDAEASAAAARKEANSVQVPGDVLKKLDYRDWNCVEHHIADKMVPEITISGRVTKIYFKPAFTGSKKQSKDKVYVQSFIVEGKSGETTQIYLGATWDIGKPVCYVIGSKEHVEARKYLDLLFKKIRP